MHEKYSELHYCQLCSAEKSTLATTTYESSQFCLFKATLYPTYNPHVQRGALRAIKSGEDDFQARSWRRNPTHLSTDFTRLIPLPS